MFFFPRESNSSKFLTSTTLACKPADGVEIDPPNEQTGTFMLLPGPVIILAYSNVPRTHFGTIKS